MGRRERGLGRSVATLAAAALVGCVDSPANVGPEPSISAREAGGGGVTPNATIIWCELHPEQCGGPGDPNPNEPGIWLGSTVTPDQCFSFTGAGINDLDSDGMHDYCEEQIADHFRPSRVFSLYDGYTAGEPYWAAKWFPGSPDIVRILYAMAYYADGGVIDPTLLQSGLCGLGFFLGSIFTFNGGLPTWEIFGIPVQDENICDGHIGDSEFVVLDVRYDETTFHWRLDRAFLSAHWGTNGDRSAWYSPHQLEYPDKVEGYPRLWVAESKHGNYPSRDECNNWQDTCESNSVSGETRVRYSRYYNLGSRVVNLVNLAVSPSSCVASASPYRTGTECFWAPEYKFYGWDPYRPPGDEQGSTPYYTVLVVKFECQNAEPSGSPETLSCDSWGVDP